MASTFSSLMSAHRRSGKSYSSSVTTSAFQSTLSNIDPRQIFDRQGMITALLPFLKSYQPRGPRKAGDAGSLQLRNEMRGVREELKDVKNEIKNVSKVISIVATNTTIMAKNSIGIPLMARDINIMRQNIQKMVKLQGGTPSTKADKDWLKAKEREEAYEVQFGKNSLKETSPSKIDAENVQKSILTTIIDFFKGSLLISGVVGAIIGAVTLYFTSDKFKNSVDNLVNGLGKFLFGEQGWQGIKDSLNESVNSLTKTIDDMKIALASIPETIATELSKIPGLIADKFNIGEIISLILTGITGIGLIKFVVGKALMNRAITKAVAKALAAAGIAVAADAVTDVDDGKNQKNRKSPKTPPSPSNKRTLNPKVPAILQNQTSIPTQSRWAKFLKFVGRKSPKLLASLTARAGLMSLATVPVVGWITAIVGMGLTIYSAYELINLWFEFNDVEPENESNSPTDVKKSIDGTLPKTVNQMSSESSQGLAKSTSPTSQISTNTLASGLQLSDDDWLRKIRMAEGGIDDPYNAMNQGTDGNVIVGSGNSSKIIGKKLTDMTVEEIMKHQSKMSGADKIFAAGAYQIIPDTLKGLVERGVVSGTDKFNEETQDKLGKALLSARKLTSLKNGTNLQNEIAKEWASVPLASDVITPSGQLRKAGESYWGGANKSSLIFSNKSLDVASATQETLSGVVYNNVDNSQTTNNYNNQSSAFAQEVASAFDMDFLNMLVDVAGNAQK